MDTINKELLDALANLCGYCNGRLGGNPYMIPEYKAALVAIHHALGFKGEPNKQAWMDAIEYYKKAKEAAK